MPLFRWHFYIAVYTMYHINLFCAMLKENVPPNHLIRNPAMSNVGITTIEL